jgi:hypothetical protein
MTKKGYKMALAYSRRASSRDWERVSDIKKTPCPARGSGRSYMDYQFDAGPNNSSRWREVSLELDVDDLKQALVAVLGTRQAVIASFLDDIARDLNSECMRADEAEKENAAMQGDIAKLKKELDDLKTNRTMRVAGGAL